MSVRAITYVRVSHDDSKASGAGEGAQIDGCREYAARKGWLFVGPYVEDGALSGATPYERCPALMDAFDELERGDVFLVFKRDRLSRDRLKILLFDGLLRKKRCRLVSASGEGTDVEDPDDPMGRLLAGMVDLFAEYERFQRIFTTRNALQRKRRTAERTGGVPYGFTLVDDGRRSKRGLLKGVERPIALEPNPQEQQAVGGMLARRQSGDTYRSIAQHLNDHNVPSRTGKPWTHSTVHHILTNLHPLLAHLKDAHQSQTEGPPAALP